MIHKIHLHPEPFEMIKSGKKTIEMRLYDEKRRKIKIGDTIEFTNRLDSSKLKVLVVNLYLFKDFDELYKAFDKRSIGYKDGEEANPNDMSKYYSEDDIKKYGTVGIEIEVI